MSKDTVNDIVQALLFMAFTTWIFWLSGGLPAC